MGTQEQRRDHRVGYTSTAIVTFRGERRAAQGVNLSAGGMRLIPAPRCSRPKPDEVIRVELNFPFTTKRVSIPGQVVYELRDGGERYWGIRFREIAKANGTLLNLYLSSQQAKPETKTSEAPQRAPSRRPSKSATQQRTPRPRRQSSFSRLFGRIVNYLYAEEPFKPPKKRNRSVPP